MAGGMHFKVDASTRLLADGEGRLKALEMRWNYDQAMTDLLLNEEDLSTPEKRDAVMAVLGDDIMADLFDLGYFTTLQANEVTQVFMTAQDYKAILNADNRIQLDFTLPLQQPRDIKDTTLDLMLADPSAGIALPYSGPEAITLDPALATRCGKPEIASSVETLNEHEVELQVVSLACK